MPLVRYQANFRKCLDEWSRFNGYGYIAAKINVGLYAGATSRQPQQVFFQLTDAGDNGIKMFLPEFIADLLGRRLYYNPARTKGFALRWLDTHSVFLFFYNYLMFMLQFQGHLPG